MSITLYFAVLNGFLFPSQRLLGLEQGSTTPASTLQDVQSSSDSATSHFLLGDCLCFRYSRFHEPFHEIMFDRTLHGFLQIADCLIISCYNGCI